MLLPYTNKKAATARRPRALPSVQEAAVPPAIRFGAAGRGSGGFTLAEIVIAVAIVAIAFLGAFATVLHAGKLVSAAEEEGLVSSGLEQRMDQMRELDWANLTNGTGVTTRVWNGARPTTMAGIVVSEERITVSPYPPPAPPALPPPPIKTLNAVWGTGAASFSFGPGIQNLSTASAVRVVATLTWTGRRSSRPQTRSLMTVISRGGISKSEIP